MSHWNPNQQQPPPPPPPPPGGHPGYGGAGNRSSFYGPPPGTPLGYPPSPSFPPPGGGQTVGVTQPTSPTYPGQQAAYNPQTYNPQTYNPQTYNPQTYNPQTYNPRIYTPQPPAAQSPQSHVPPSPSYSQQSPSQQAFPQHPNPQAYNTTSQTPQPPSQQPLVQQAYPPQPYPPQSQSLAPPAAYSYAPQPYSPVGSQPQANLLQAQPQVPQPYSRPPSTVQPHVPAPPSPRPPEAAQSLPGTVQTPYLQENLHISSPLQETQSHTPQSPAYPPQAPPKIHSPQPVAPIIHAQDTFPLQQTQSPPVPTIQPPPTNPTRPTNYQQSYVQDEVPQPYTTVSRQDPPTSTSQPPDPPPPYPSETPLSTAPIQKPQGSYIEQAHVAVPYPLTPQPPQAHPGEHDNRQSSSAPPLPPKIEPEGQTHGQAAATLEGMMASSSLGPSLFAAPGFNPFKRDLVTPKPAVQTQEPAEIKWLGPYGRPPIPTTAPQPGPLPLKSPIPNQNLRAPGPIARICVRTPVTFPLTWYTHPEAPHFHICSRCYLNNIWETIFRDDFQAIAYGDGQARVCKFNYPWIKDLFKNAVTAQKLDWFVGSIKMPVPACKGVAGVKGTEHAQWYAARDNAIPSMVICEECYRNYVLSRGMSICIPLSRDKQEDDAVWACDFALPFIKDEYLKRGETGDWDGFCKEANARMQIQPCPGADVINAKARNWFVPNDGTPGFVVCHACYCDYILNSGKADDWKHSPDVAEDPQREVTCSLGQLNMFEALDVAQQENDMGVFWRAAQYVAKEPICHSNGMKNATWFTLASDPKDFAICGGCYYGMVQPWSATHLFTPKPGTDSTTTLLCSFNRSAPRFEKYMSKACEAFYTMNLDVLEEYIKNYSGIPVCGKDKDFKDRNWFGWEECTICPECYHDVVRGTAFADTMPLHGAPISASRSCELYSPKMRALYAEACQTGTPTTLLAKSLERRAVYFETMPVLRRIYIQTGFILVKALIQNTPAGDRLEVNGDPFGGEAEGLAEVFQASGEWETIKALEDRWRAVE